MSNYHNCINVDMLTKTNQLLILHHFMNKYNFKTKILKISLIKIHKLIISKQMDQHNNVILLQLKAYGINHKLFILHSNYLIICHILFYSIKIFNIIHIQTCYEPLI